MREFKDCTPKEGVSSASLALSRLTVMRHIRNTAPVRELLHLLYALSEGDALLAAEHYHGMAAALLAAPVRRVSGELFTDFLLHELLEEENAFSLMAARNEKDIPTVNAMRYDLTHLSRLAGLTGTVLKRWMTECRQERRAGKRAPDTIAVMSGAAWAGSPPPAKAQENVPIARALPLPEGENEAEWLSTRYEASPEFGEYVSDEALEEIYHRLLSLSDWRDCLEDLWNFHASYGTGMFLKDRLFAFSEGELLPLSEEALPEEGSLLLHEQERATLMQHVIRFMQGDAPERVLLCGGAGSGKTSAVLALIRELPEVRLVMVSPEDYALLPALSKKLSEEPLRFLLLADDADFASPAFLHLKRMLSSGSVGGRNQLLVFTAREGDDSLFPCRIELSYPEFRAFVELVQRLLAEDGTYLDYTAVQDACLDHKQAVSGELSFTAARRIADGLRG